MTINSDAFMSILSTSFIEPWWEQYWILKTQITNIDQHQYFMLEIKFYYLSVSTHQKKSHQKH